MDKFFVKENMPSVYTEIPWHFKTSDKKFFDTDLVLVKSETTEKNGVLCSEFVYEACGIVAKRMSFQIGNSVAFVYDSIDSEKELCVYSDFVIQNNDLSVECNIADKSKLVIRSKNTGIKHFRLSSLLDECSVMDSIGILMPYKVKSNGDIVYSMYEGLYNYGNKHRCLFGFTADSPEKIPGWHFYDSDKGFKACAPGNATEHEIEISENQLKIYDAADDKCIVDIRL